MTSPDDDRFASLLTPEPVAEETASADVDDVQGINDVDPDEQGGDDH